MKRTPGGERPAAGASHAGGSHAGASHAGGSHSGGSHAGGSHAGGSHAGGSHAGGMHWGVGLSRVALALVFLLGLLYLAQPASILPFPNWFWPGPQPWWWPYRPQSHAYPPFSLVLAVGGVGALVLAVTRLDGPPPSGSNVKRGALLLLGSLLLNAAALHLPGGGLMPYGERLARIGHAEFFARAATTNDVWKTLREYPALMRDGEPATFCRNKNPATLAYHVLLHRFAQRPLLRRFLDPIAAAHPGSREAVYRALRRGPGGGFRAFSRETSDAMLRAFLLTPLVSLGFRCGLVLCAFGLGLALFHRKLAVLLAVTMAAAPPLVMENLQLDGGLYPLLFVAGLSLFALGWTRGRRSWLFAGGAVATLYLYCTFAGLVLIAICLGTAGLACLSQARSNPARGRTVVGHFITYGSGIALSLACLVIFVDFNPVDRYLDGRAVQAGWRGAGPNWRWVVLNATEFVFSLGPWVTALATLGVALSLRALRRRRVCLAPALSIASTATFGLVLFGTDYSEVYRLWAFLGLAFAMPAIVAAQPLFGLHRRRGALLYALAVLTWGCAAATRYGHFG